MGTHSSAKTYPVQCSLLFMTSSYILVLDNLTVKWQFKCNKAVFFNLGSAYYLHGSVRILKLELF